MKRINCFHLVQELTTLLIVASLVEEIIFTKARHHYNKSDDIFPSTSDNDNFFRHSIYGLTLFFCLKTQEILEFLCSDTSFMQQ